MPHTIDTEPNNNTIKSLTTSIISGSPDTEIGTNDSQILVQTLSNNKNDSKVINVGGLNGVYIQSDIYRPFTIFDSDNEKFAVLPPSTTGSLTSITTTSVASSEPDPGSDKGGDDGGNDKLTGNGIVKEEEWWRTTIQVSIPFLIAGIGTIGAGIILGIVEQWTVFNSIRELFILGPALLGLKGNLDMCLASRLSTQANLGNMTSRREILSMVVGNISLVQVQAIVASFIVSVFAITVGSAMNNSFVLDHAILMIASSMFTATISCFLLDFVLVAVILLSFKFNLNPDNLATPLAASIGDVVSLSILSTIASLLYANLAAYSWLSFMIISIYFILLPLWIICVLYNKYTLSILKSGWVPVLSALFISGFLMVLFTGLIICLRRRILGGVLGVFIFLRFYFARASVYMGMFWTLLRRLGGLVLDQAVDAFKGFVVFQPIINGIGGNLVSVQASKMSTFLHQSSILGIVPPHSNVCENPFRALVTGVPYAKAARILILMSIPGQIIFIFVADIIHMGESTIGAVFVFSYLFASFIQICLLLYIAHVLIHAMWSWKIDPDNSAIPYLTALGDLFGSTLLALAFLFIQSVGHGYGEQHIEEIGP